ncbi:GLPGLI family protein [Chryseobacterium sp. M5]|uniref:GLPGLI family protein n=1 Tax=Chryseobacterium sp. M5 TaxID=3379128 RepID=UPI0038572D7F
MLKTIFFLYLTFSTLLINAQTFTGIYVFKINSAVPSQTYNTLISSKNTTWFFQTKVETLADISNVDKITRNGTTIENISDNYTNIIPASSPEYYKSEQGNKLLSRNFYLTKPCYIKEDLEQFDWNISEEMITYNNKKYNVATADFRGKSWIVYFDKNVGFNVAPWKFYGLPGAVVYAKTTDNSYSFELKEYKIDEKDTVIKNPFETELFVSWDDYKSNYKDYLKKLVKKWTADSEDGDGGSIKLDNVIEDLGFTEIK